ncbi:hypothetical protein IWQ60_001032 [Tieghemiomyces parasiticus]|uniref:NADH dehydrogenase [ubiquinone] 1 alpha subcomplex subunit 1 n=1 Tax=Tieghemiomyces parasiticus TaxID=78921 RepID=A0A9W8ALR8_9FUNG|nr:hypothetical protein IWQ60_001032 [Tieghemiomyces parasiticus]
MPVPFEAVIPFGIIAGLMSVTGLGLMAAQRARNDWKPQRYDVDDWDLLMMERDKRLTGTLRGQSDNPIAPPGFATNSIWRVYKPI